MAKSSVPIISRIPKDPNLRRELLDCILTRAGTANYRIGGDGYVRVRGRGQGNSIGPADEILVVLRGLGLPAPDGPPAPLSRDLVAKSEPENTTGKANTAKIPEGRIARSASVAIFITTVLLLAFLVFLFWAVPTLVRFYISS